MDQTFIPLNTNSCFDLLQKTIGRIGDTLASAQALAQSALAHCPTKELFRRATASNKNPYLSESRVIDAAFLHALHFFVLGVTLDSTEGHPLLNDGVRSAVGARLQRYLTLFLALASPRAARFTYRGDDVEYTFGEGSAEFWAWRDNYLGALGVVRLAYTLANMRFTPELPPVYLDKRGVDLVARGQTVNLAFQVKARGTGTEHRFAFLVSQGDGSLPHRRLYGHSKQLAKDTGQVWTPIEAEIGLQWKSEDAPNLWEKCDPRIERAFVEALKSIPQVSS